MSKRLHRSIIEKWSFFLPLIQQKLIEKLLQEFSISRQTTFGQSMGVCLFFFFCFFCSCVLNKFEGTAFILKWDVGAELFPGQWIKTSDNEIGSMFSHYLLMYFMDDVFCCDGNVTYFEPRGGRAWQPEPQTVIWNKRNLS